jgi:hypothetical protein
MKRIPPARPTKNHTAAISIISRPPTACVDAAEPALLEGNPRGAGLLLATLFGRFFLTFGFLTPWIARSGGLRLRCGGLRRISLLAVRLRLLIFGTVCQEVVRRFLLGVAHSFHAGDGDMEQNAAGGTLALFPGQLLLDAHGSTAFARHEDGHRKSPSITVRPGL